MPAAAMTGFKSLMVMELHFFLNHVEEGFQLLSYLKQERQLLNFTPTILLYAKGSDFNIPTKASMVAT